MTISPLRGIAPALPRKKSQTLWPSNIQTAIATMVFWWFLNKSTRSFVSKPTHCTLERRDRDSFVFWSKATHRSIAMTILFFWSKATQATHWSIAITIRFCFFGAKQHIGASPFLLLEQRNIVEGASRSRFFFFEQTTHWNFLLFGAKQHSGASRSLSCFLEQSNTHTLEHRDHDSVFWSKTTQWSIAITILFLLEQSNTLEYLDEEPSGESENKKPIPD